MQNWPKFVLRLDTNILWTFNEGLAVLRDFSAWILCASRYNSAVLLISFTTNYKRAFLIWGKYTEEKAYFGENLYFSYYRNKLFPYVNSIDYYTDYNNIFRLYWRMECG